MASCCLMAWQMGPLYIRESKCRYIMHILKNLIRRTPLYPFLQSRRSARNFTFPEWTDHDQEMLNFYAQFIGPNKMFYDVGANIGNRTNVFLRLNIKVISVEPQKSCIQALEQRFKKSKDLTILPSAVGAAISGSRNKCIRCQCPFFYES